MDLRFVAAYALVLIAAALLTPLRVPEVLSLGWSVHFSWSGFWTWISRALDPSPLAYLIQLPFVLAFGASRLGPRIPGILFAAVSCVLFLRLAQRAAVKRHYEALLLFMLLPVQLLAVMASTQYEMATVFVLFTTLAFFDLVAQPSYKTGAIFAIAVTICLYTDRHAALPAVGAVLFLLRFSGRPRERQAVWFALASCLAAATMYFPYYVWAHRKADPYWLVEPGLSVSRFANGTIVEWALAAAVLIILAGIIGGAGVSFRLPISQVKRRLILFCLFGSVIVTLAFIVSSSLYMLYPLATRDLLYAAPSAVIVFVMTVDWLMEKTALRIPIAAVAITVLVVCALTDIEWVTSPKENIALESRYIAPELTGDSCVIFVSLGYSSTLFLVFQPQLESRQCQDYFHHRIVLANHPYVRPDQQADAEGYFRGLNFRVAKRIRSGGGEIVVEQNN
ncbi:MAG TPA: glycosyltransferase family 39 protein [Bryobacteraceae bacterium]|nr:glycosyltransferase family 39 protein [Bryobacteraceae bacterium]